ncbi:flavin reductase family protein [Micromonospora sp. WMMD1128]|uniref:flavin reductase family protein n=1 Tax=unclassified Micromonospora TaxID=2617518 RepID=UPI00248BF1C7|nr:MULTISPECIES: flavin reductase family protein [unclassified Micromonospora]WBB75812.1 flavin reductase family protein [Micromonospora sp. WMMD1128]WFE36398.1 flavin reductase family protein [Micromonospora sp. WMMD975]
MADRPPLPSPAGDASDTVSVTEPGALRALFGAFATGVTVVTVAGPAPHGMTANSFASVSLDPPLALVCVGRDTTMYARLSSRRCFAVSVLDADQEHLARYFADPRRPTGAAQFAGVNWRAGPVTGAPLLAGALAWLECRLWRAYDGGDHVIVVGRILSAHRAGAPAALVFFGGHFGRLPVADGPRPAVGVPAGRTTASG